MLFLFRVLYIDFYGKEVQYMKKTNSSIWRIMITKKRNRTVWEQLELTDWINKWIGTPIRIIVFPIALVVKLYRWTYD